MWEVICIPSIILWRELYQFEIGMDLTYYLVQPPLFFICRNRGLEKFSDVPTVPQLPDHQCSAHTMTPYRLWWYRRAFTKHHLCIMICSYVWKFCILRLWHTFKPKDWIKLHFRTNWMHPETWVLFRPSELSGVQWRLEFTLISQNEMQVILS